MTRTANEKREYSRGYSRAISRMHGHAQRIIKIAKGYRARLSETHDARKCITCARWTRGCDRCVWGFCAADFEHGIEPRMWAEGPPPTCAKGQIVTTEDFGCVNWLPHTSAETAAP